MSLFFIFYFFIYGIDVWKDFNNYKILSNINILGNPSTM